MWRRLAPLRGAARNIQQATCADGDTSVVVAVEGLTDPSLSPDHFLIELLQSGTRLALGEEPG